MTERKRITTETPEFRLVPPIVDEVVPPGPTAETMESAPMQATTSDTAAGAATTSEG